MRTWTSLNLSDLQAALLNHFTPYFHLKTRQLVDLIKANDKYIDGKGPTLVHNVTTTGPSQRNWKAVAADSGEYKNKPEL